MSSPVHQAEDENAKDYLQIKVTGQDSIDVVFKVKKTTKLGKLMGAYANRTGVPKSTYRFLFDGKRIGDQQTPEELEMEDDDVIEAFCSQEGGCLA